MNPPFPQVLKLTQARFMNANLDKPFRLLVVEDNAGLNHLICQTMRKAGFPVEGVHESPQAISSISDNNNVLVILDYKLGDENAESMLETLSERGLVTPFIIMTGHGSEKIAVKLMKLGARDYIVKDTELLDRLPQIVQRVYNELDRERRLAEAEAALRETEARNQAILNLLPDMIFKTDRDGVIICAHGAEVQLSQSAENLIGKSYRELLPKTIANKYAEHLSRTINSREIQVFEYELTCDSKHRLYESRMVASSDGTVVCIVRDVTEIRKTELALRESEGRFQLALKKAPIIMFNQDRELRYTWIHNPNHATSPDKHLAQTDYDIYPRQTADKLSELKRGVLNSGLGCRTEVTVNSGSSDLTFDITIEPLDDVDGAIVGITCAALDITERKRAELEREELIEDLKKALAEVKTLSGLLPICANCKKIRDDKGYWNQIEQYLYQHTGVEFSHGLCPDCRKELYGDL